MKIRTDFVTNSSSSSFVVEISIKTAKDKEITMIIDADEEGANGNVNIGCVAKDILEIESVEGLTALLAESINVEYPDEVIEECVNKIQEFGEEISQTIKTIDEISTISLKRIWTAWGEGASCFAWNLPLFAKELPELAQRVCEYEGNEKEKAKTELINYLSNYAGYIDSEWGGKFPTGFMGADVKGEIVWKEIADTIEEFAEKVVLGDLPDYDYAIETTTVDIEKKQINQRAEYILGGLPEEDDEDEWDD